MEATEVGIREFRADLAEYIAASSPVAVTLHGQTVGYFIPVHGQAEADLVAERRRFAAAPRRPQQRQHHGRRQPERVGIGVDGRIAHARQPRADDGDRRTERQAGGREEHPEDRLPVRLVRRAPDRERHARQRRRTA